MSLNEDIKTQASSCLNESPMHKWHSILHQDTNYLKSDCDPQLLLNLAFRSTIKIHSIRFVCSQTDFAPKTVKLYANQNYMDFNSVHDIPPSQVLSLTPKTYQPNEIVLLNSLKFTKVRTLSLFIEDNQQNRPHTILEYIQIIGKPN
uniref:PITH domain-containing protein n=1 Tax=Arcella intermedia TaxID=1963864 RepID=A0A6B2LLG2_9EUKA